MAKQKYSYGQAPTDTAKAAQPKPQPKITKTVYVTIPKKPHLTGEQKEKEIATRKMSNDELKQKYGLDGSVRDEKRKDNLKFEVKAIEKKPLASESYEKDLEKRKTKHP